MDQGRRWRRAGACPAATLNDLVSYNAKHNQENGEDNRDGANENLSWNCGVEGPSDDPEIEGLRNRQVKNFLALLLLATGTPMLMMGDEVRRTQRGNNNAYCQDNEVSWLDWGLLERHADVHRFVRLLAQLRVQRDVVVEGTRMTLQELLARAHIIWHGVALGCPDWSEKSHSLAFTLQSLSGRYSLHGLINAFWEPLTFELPAVPRGALGTWRRCIDTALASPDDIHHWHEAPPYTASSYLVGARSLVLLALAHAPV